MNDGIPVLGDLLRELPPVLRWFLRPELTPYQRWFPADDHGEVDAGLVRQAFAEASRNEELSALMPLMAHTEKRDGTPPHPATGSSGAAYLFGGEGRSLNPGADIIGPLWMGKNVRVRMSTLIVGPVLIGDDARISSNASAVRCIIGPRTRIDDGASLKYSIVGADCFVAGKLLSEEASRTNGDPITFECWFKSPGWLIPRRLRVTVPRPKMGCVIGDGCRVGKGVLLMPGTVLMPGVIVREDAGTIPVGIYSQEDLNRLLSGR
ncbi:hypothetical protein M0Q28_03810 [Patescibacteria group bacterium]|jgi:NDP-sugar pyrophosphorylase family protein|nr:hypothetical protein [Patescibacteria group bacterium]